MVVDDEGDPHVFLTSWKSVSGPDSYLSTTFHHAERTGDGRWVISNDIVPPKRLTADFELATDGRRFFLLVDHQQRLGHQQPVPPSLLFEGPPWREVGSTSATGLFVAGGVLHTFASDGSVMHIDRLEQGALVPFSNLLLPGKNPVPRFLDLPDGPALASVEPSPPPPAPERPSRFYKPYDSGDPPGKGTLYRRIDRLAPIVERFTAHDASDPTHRFPSVRVDGEGQVMFRDPRQVPAVEIVLAENEIVPPGCPLNDDDKLQTCWPSPHVERFKWPVVAPMGHGAIVVGTRWTHRERAVWRQRGYHPEVDARWSYEDGLIGHGRLVTARIEPGKPVRKQAYAIAYDDMTELQVLVDRYQRVHILLTTTALKPARYARLGCPAARSAP